MSTLFSGIPRELVKDSGGLYEVYITELHNVPETGVTINYSGGTAYFITAAGVWKRFTLGKEAGSDLVITTTNNLTNGTTETDTVLKMIFKRNQISKRNEARILSANEMVVVICDNASPITTTGDTSVGNTYVIGLQYGVNQGGAELRTNVSSTGAQFADSNNMTVTIGCKETHVPFGISTAALLAIRAGAAVTGGNFMLKRNEHVDQGAYKTEHKNPVNK